MIKLLMPVVFAISFAQGPGLPFQHVDKPFHIRVFYTAMTDSERARLEIEANWSEVQPTEISILNHTLEVGAEVSNPTTPDNNGRFVVPLGDVFELRPGVNEFSVSVRSSNGSRTVVGDVEVYIQ